MGNRALVVFHDGDGNSYSPTVYLHWQGSQVPKLLAEWRALMEGRMGDLSYGCARFIGICHVASAGNMSLGTWNTEPGVREESNAARVKRWTEDSHGDAGVFLVDVKDGAVERIGGSQSECKSLSRFKAGETDGEVDA